ncbi:MAG: glycoside hydrolase family 44 protein [Anaerohalosphaeraceae bacterium]
MRPLEWFFGGVCVVSAAAWGAISVQYSINTESGRAMISPYIYGANFDHVTCGNLTVRRMGGNRTTGYNWENNFSNAGSDWYHSSDRYMSAYLPWNQQLIPGKVYADFRQADIQAGRASVLTLQMAGYVAADDWGTVTEAQTAPSSRWKEVVYKKNAPFCVPAGSPSTTDNFVYMDEFVNYLVTTFGNANTPTGVKFYSLDNEPALWAYTHPRIHPNKVGCVELINRSTALASAVKDVDPYAQITGPVLYGFAAFLHLQDAPDWNSVKGSYSWFIDYYLVQMKNAGTSAGRRLLDVLDLHWYPEARDNNNVRITDFAATETNYVTRMQAPRTLWDSGYIENSWIGQWFSSYLPLLPKIFNSIQTYYPGTKLAFTEYNYGGENHISGGIAQADVLGIFGKYGVYLAAYWGANGVYTNAAFNLYRNYDGNGSTFGDVKVSASMSDKVNSSIYASMFSGLNNRLHLIVLNKHLTEPISGSFVINSPCLYTSGRVWAFDGSSTSITERTPVSAIVNNAFSYSIPPLTACHFVLQSERPLADLSGDCQVGLEDLALFCGQWLAEGLGPQSSCGDFNRDGVIDGADWRFLADSWLH